MIKNALMLLVCLTIAACAGTTGRNAAKSSVRNDLLVSTDWLESQLGEDDLVILHVAEDRDNYEKEHIVGARFLSKDKLVTTRNGIPNELPPVEELRGTFGELGVSNEDLVIIYDEDKGLWAARAFVTLDYLGHGDQTALLDGQFKKWKAENRPLSSGVPGVAPTTFDANVRGDVVVPHDEMTRIVATKDERYEIVDARPMDQYTGRVPGEGVKRPGHIPGATHIYWEETLTDGEFPTVKPVAELERMFGSSNDTVITYCRTGGQASFDYFIARYLGRDTRLYD